MISGDEWLMCVSLQIHLTTMLSNFQSFKIIYHRLRELRSGSADVLLFTKYKPAFNGVPVILIISTVM